MEVDEDKGSLCGLDMPPGAEEAEAEPRRAYQRHTAAVAGHIQYTAAAAEAAVPWWAYSAGTEGTAFVASAGNLAGASASTALVACTASAEAAAAAAHRTADIDSPIASAGRRSCALGAVPLTEADDDGSWSDHPGLPFLHGFVRDLLGQERRVLLVHQRRHAAAMADDEARPGPARHSSWHSFGPWPSAWPSSLLRRRCTQSHGRSTLHRRGWRHRIPSH
mmetsp:Transcript_29451/g.85698  ORF Transcript_29451/g.85698 Transcript_29451/m.85698 type:complete len:221 (-) Transcript_29451:1311-1973(-)